MHVIDCTSESRYRYIYIDRSISQAQINSASWPVHVFSRSSPHSRLRAVFGPWDAYIFAPGHGTHWYILQLTPSRSLIRAPLVLDLCIPSIAPHPPVCSTWVYCYFFFCLCSSLELAIVDRAHHGGCNLVSSLSSVSVSHRMGTWPPATVAGTLISLVASAACGFSASGRATALDHSPAAAVAVSSCNDRGSNTSTSSAVPPASTTCSSPHETPRLTPGPCNPPPSAARALPLPAAAAPWDGVVLVAIVRGGGEGVLGYVGVNGPPAAVGVEPPRPSTRARVRGPSSRATAAAAAAAATVLMWVAAVSGKTHIGTQKPANRGHQNRHTHTDTQEMETHTQRHRDTEKQTHNAESRQPSDHTPPPSPCTRTGELVLGQ